MKPEQKAFVDGWMRGCHYAVFAWLIGGGLAGLSHTLLLIGAATAIVVGGVTAFVLARRMQ